jgi:transforming growth factor-beta-induced protein
MKKTITLLLTGMIGLGAPLMAEETEPLSIAEIAAYSPDNFSTLTAALVSTDLAQVLNNEGDFTVFAPTNAAFDAAAVALSEGAITSGLDLILTLPKEDLADILLYHVLPESLNSVEVLATDTYTTVNGADITRQDADPLLLNGGQASLINVEGFIDIHASNGIVHVITGVLLPPVVEEPVSIYETAVATPALSTLVAAIDKAHLAGVLSSDRFQFTVFAPINAAFDEVAVALYGEGATGMDVVDNLSAWELRKILFNHLLWGERFSDSILDSTRYFTLGWGRLTREDLTLFSRNGSGTLLAPDLINIDATNGVVHVIDGVLLP